MSSPDSGGCPESLTSLHPHIRRRDDAHGRAWLVRVVRKDFRHERMFSDSTYGGMAQALAAAQQWRDAQPWYQARRPAGPGRRARPASVPADRQPERYISVVMINGQPCPCAFWRASWTDARGRTWVRKFSVNFWGEAVARQMALRIHNLTPKP